MLLPEAQQGAHEVELVREPRPFVGVGGCESGCCCAAMSSRSGMTMSGRPGVYRRHCIAAFTKHVLPARQRQHPTSDTAWSRISWHPATINRRCNRQHCSLLPARAQLMSHGLRPSLVSNTPQLKGQQHVERARRRTPTLRRPTRPRGSTGSGSRSGSMSLWPTGTTGNATSSRSCSVQAPH